MFNIFKKKPEPLPRPRSPVFDEIDAMFLKHGLTPISRGTSFTDSYRQMLKALKTLDAKLEAIDQRTSREKQT